MILTRDHGAVRELQLDRPPANALSPDLVTAITAAVRAAPGEGARAIVLSGLPGRFSGGLDVPFLLTVDRPGIAAAWRGFYEMMHTLVASPVPVAAAITGHAPAGGTVLAILCDWRGVAEGDWRLGLNEVQVGLPLPPVIFKVLQRQVGPRHAEQLAVAGALIPPAEALRIGLVDEVVPAERLVERAVEWCNGLLALPPEAFAATRRQARADLVALLEDAVEREVAQVEESWWHPEAQSVLSAVVERMRQKKR